jgi:hypothetical protein
MSEADKAPDVLRPLQPAMAFSGKLVRGETDGSVRGWLFDHRSGTRIEFDGCRDPRGGGYLLAGRVVPV